MKIRSRKSVLSLLLLPLLAACSGRVMQKEKMQEIHQVAIVGLDLQQQKPISGGDVLGAVLGQSADTSAAPRDREDSNQATRVYEEFASQLKTHMGWKIIPMKDVQANLIYQTLFKDKTEGFQNRPFVNARYDLLTVPKILDSFAIYTLEKDRLKSLQQALRVDALVVANLKMDLNNNNFLASMVGSGEFKPFAVTSVQVLDGVSDQKLWVEQVEGPKVAEGQKNTIGMTDEVALNNKYFEAARLSFQTLFEKSSLK